MITNWNKFKRKETNLNQNFNNIIKKILITLSKQIKKILCSRTLLETKDNRNLVIKLTQIT